MTLVLVALLWTAAAEQTLAITYTTLDYPGGHSTFANGIDGNNIVGGYTDSSAIFHGFLYNGATYTTLDHPLATNGTIAAGIDGNNIVGFYNNSSGGHGFLYNGTTYTTLDFPGGSQTGARGIDGNNIVGGYSDGSKNHGFLYNGTTYTTLDYPLATGSTFAYGIDGNNIVGQYNGATNGFLYNGATYTTLDYPGSLSTRAVGIDGNNIVGYYNGPSGGRGFLYDGSTYTTLNYPLVTGFTNAYGIDGNNIVGAYAIDMSGSSGIHGFVATVPEPGSGVLAIVAGGLMWVLRKRLAKVAMHRTFASLVLFCAIGLLVPPRAGAVTIAWSPVGNPGNAGELSGEGAGGFGSTAILGAVGYNYRMGTYDVTAGQYVEFLNAKDSSGLNPLGLYRSSMSNATYGGISFSAGNANGSKYGVKAGRGNHPVNYLTGYAAYRFANWLNNGQGSGDTESGAYTLLGGTPTPSNALSIPRNAGATVFLPTEDEWYKAAYYNPGSSSYFHYPTSSNTQPTWTGPTAVPNSANYGRVVGNLTDVGAYSGTTSPYGAFDMGGNVYQWIEGDNLGPYWRLRGGSWIDDSIYLESKNHSNAFDPTDGLEQIGFRVASIPEPSTGVLAVMAGGLMWWWRRRSSREKGTSWFSSKSTMSPGMSPFSSQKCCIGNQQQRRLPRRTKPVALVLVALLWTAATSPSLAVTYTTLDDPLGTNDGSFPNGIDGNKIVGLYVDSSGIHGYLYNGTTFTTLANPPGTNGWVPRGVSGGNIVGLYNDASFGSHGVLYNGATFTTLDHPLATNGTRAFGIDGNRIVGMYIDSSGQHGFLYNGTTYTTIDDPLVGAFGTNAIGISGNNIVGKYNDASGTHGFLYNGTTYTTLDFPGGSTTVAQGIDGNNIVGSYDNATGQHGFLYDGTIYTTLDYPLATAGATSARGIDGNNIVGSYSYASSSHGFLANVPEPSTAVLAAMACGLMWWWRKRFK